MNADVDRLLLTEEQQQIRCALEAMSGAHYSLAALNRYVANTTTSPFRLVSAQCACWLNMLVARRLERRSKRLSKPLGA